VRIAKLEAALQDTFDREHLAVYADALQARGDPRGELIAIDLHIDAHGSTAELAARRGELIAAWLGNFAASRVVRVRYGFVHVANVSPAEIGPVLASPAGAHLRCIEVYGLGARLLEVLAALAAKPRRRATTTPRGFRIRARSRRSCPGTLLAKGNTRRKTPAVPGNFPGDHGMASAWASGCGDDRMGIHAAHLPRPRPGELRRATGRLPICSMPWQRAGYSRTPAF
jgi:hypothetical protein